QPIPAAFARPHFQRRQDRTEHQIQHFFARRRCHLSSGSIWTVPARATEAARAQLLGTQDAQQTVVLTLVSDVASDYFLLRDLDLQLQITTGTVRDQQESVKLTELRLQHGVATTLDVLQARQVLDVANAQIPDLERQIGQTEDAINILLGKYPDNVPRGEVLAIEASDGWKWTETLPPQLPTGLPSQLLERRPDIHQAEQNLVA